LDVKRQGTSIVFGVANEQSIAWAIVQELLSRDAHVVAVVQTQELLEKRVKPRLEKAGMLTPLLNLAVCDVADHDQIKQVYADHLDVDTNPLIGLVHSIGFAPSSCLGHDLGTAPVEDVKLGFEISAASLAYLVEYAKPYFGAEGAGVVTMEYAWERVSPQYKWMGAFKAALAYLVKDLAGEVGRMKVTVNAVSAGPQETLAARGIPGFGNIRDPWNDKAPLGWNPRDKHPVAKAVVDLLSAEGITGEEIHVDGGMHTRMPI
jgi:enoyl ACP reductase